jgi:hypothetical protein
MSEFGKHAHSFTFTSNRFDHSSELPPEYNAGNRFYGRDVAEFVSAGLGARGLDSSFFDEDWGWMVHAGLPDGGVLEVAVYHNPEGDPATEDDWSLMVRSLRKEKWLGILPRFKEREIEAPTLAALRDVFGDAGIELRREA